MRRIVLFAALAASLLLVIPSSFAGSAPASKGVPGTIVLVFKDGHRQSFNLADIERVEFPVGAAVEAPGSATLPPRGHFLGKWEVGDGNGNNFFITLYENGAAERSLRSIHGSWAYVNGEAQIMWDDGAMDAIRKVGPKYEKFAYHRGETFSDRPDNVANARNTANKPI